ncbi:hypothetical protein BST61_g299 [Cercospora zeina]
MFSEKPYHCAAIDVFHLTVAADARYRDEAQQSNARRTREACRCLARRLAPNAGSPAVRTAKQLEDSATPVRRESWALSAAEQHRSDNALRPAVASVISRVRFLRTNLAPGPGSASFARATSAIPSPSGNKRAVAPTSAPAAQTTVIHRLGQSVQRGHVDICSVCSSVRTP